MKYTVKGLIYRDYMDSVAYDMDDYREEMLKSEVLCCEDSNHTKFEIIFKINYDMCGSGYTTAEEAYIEINEVKRFSPFLYEAKEDISFDMTGNIYDYETMENNVFVISRTGGNDYYPSGNYEIYLHNFEIK